MTSSLASSLSLKFGQGIAGVVAVMVVYNATPAQTNAPPSNRTPDTTSAGPGAGVSTCEIPAATAKKPLACCIVWVNASHSSFQNCPVESTLLTGLFPQYAYILNPMRSPLAFTYPSALRNRPHCGL